MLESISGIGGIYTIIFLVLKIVYTTFHLSGLDELLIAKMYGIRKKPQTLMYYLCFCSKKRKDKADTPAKDKNGLIYVSTEIYDNAKKFVRETLDVTGIVKDLNSIKFILHYLMDDYQRQLLPIVTLNL